MRTNIIEEFKNVCYYVHCICVVQHKAAHAQDACGTYISTKWLHNKLEQSKCVEHIARQQRPIAADGKLKVSNLVFDWLKFFLGNTQISKFDGLKNFLGICLFDCPFDCLIVHFFRLFLCSFVVHTCSFSTTSDVLVEVVV